LHGAERAGARGDEPAQHQLLAMYQSDPSATADAARAVLQAMALREALAERGLRRSQQWTSAGVRAAFAHVDERELVHQERELAFGRAFELLGWIPGCPSVSFALAIAHLELRQFDRALQLLGGVPQDSGYKLNLCACVHSERGDPVGAVAWAERALALRPGWLVARDNLARFVGDAGDLERAARLHAEVLDEDPDYAWAHANLAAVLERRGDRAGALASLQRSLELGYPGWRVAVDEALDALKVEPAYLQLMRG